MDRVSRRLTDLKQNKIHVARYKPSVAILKEGEEVLYVRKDGILSRYRKEQGILWRSDMFKNEDIISKGTIRTKNLQYDTKFIDHRMFVHNFQDDISTSEVFLPWFSITEQTGMDQEYTAYLTPYTMSCEKILFRPETLTDTSADLTFKIKKQDDGDATVDTVATATYTATLASNTSIVVNRSDFDNPPTVGAKDKVAISVQAGADPSGEIDWYVTSVWKTEIQV
jgi:hypothetical protein|tara:strand:- start:5151 stop:5825 length:675 start_codon:yes stop_codon:yes gene_type:complete